MKKCIFCRADSGNSQSREHIIPESIGNKKNYLPPGVVCDKCNNYFAVKVEKPLLEEPFFNQLRARNTIPSKKGAIPIETIWFHSHKHKVPQTELHFYKPRKGMPRLIVPDEIGDIMISAKTSEYLITSLRSDIPPEENRLISRLLGKIGVEILAQLSIEQNQDLNKVVIDEGLDRIKKFARFDSPRKPWPYYVQKIYDENEKFYYLQELNEPVDVLYQYKLFYIKSDLYVNVIIKGYEFIMNLIDSNNDSYFGWKIMNPGKSHLYNGHKIINVN